MGALRVEVASVVVIMGWWLLLGWGFVGWFGKEEMGCWLVVGGEGRVGRETFGCRIGCAATVMSSY